ncbi:phytoene synthase [Sphingobium sp. B2D3A]|uniref:hypothetical protein n=1 Tax=unclassified Sphingobium TaxID=2611147 RepID=UPI0022241761|nr:MULTISPECIES: hypothetical protein [unclassified Sphingobium]MCW2337865.1 phytoene synthase [Sphingobium sp. B2D3A]MCW2384323.1 phytoene synthase [Sphingobium sp. B2D3D]
MNAPPTALGADHEPAPLQRLLLAHAPAAERSWHALCWQLDARLAELIRRRADPTIAAIRLAWWDAVLVERDDAKGRGEPLVDAWRQQADAGASTAAERLIDGWRVLASPDPLSDEDLLDYALARGGGLFALLAGGESEAANRLGALWALWDLAGHASEEALGRRSLTLASDFLPRDARSARSLPRPLRLLAAVAMPDVRAARLPSRGFTPRQYSRLLIAALRG